MDPLANNYMLPVSDKAPTITIKGNVWTYVSADKILVSSTKSDKEFMIRMLQEWDYEQRIR